jgi:hypothetical protein
MSTEMDTGEIRALVPGQHLHLDEIIENAPAPGSLEWLPIMRSLALEIHEWGEGSWGVSIQLGTVKKPPCGPIPTESIPALIEQAERFTPPDVWRLESGPSHAWEGEKTTWDTDLTARVRECVTYSRSADDREAGEDFTVWITYLVDEPT